ncbi:MAG: hypothetical protein P8P74_16100 [Crocinitomicaceae bacterium]|nr:hypothetical protein [Crocinitomicaceae bacterium]
MKSKSFPERVAIIEFDSSHDECLLTQINALKKQGCWILLVTNEIVRERNSHLIDLVDEWSNIDPKGKHLNGAAIGDAMIIRRLMRFLKKQTIDTVIFNTAQGGHVRNACLFSLFRKQEFVGIIHTIRKFQGSFTQGIINLKIKKYLVLTEFLKEQIPTKKGFQFESFYALDFPKGDEASTVSDAVHISIIGSVESRRKDLDGFVSLVEQSDDSIYFRFLGKADPSNSDVIKLKQKLEKVGRLNQVEFNEKRIEFNEMDQILRKTTAILPLVHPDTPSATEYFRNQIPGSMNIALAYKIPLLLHKEFKNISELNAASCYYSLDQFSNTIDELTAQNLAIRRAMKAREQYSTSWNHDQYLEFLKS